MRLGESYKGGWTQSKEIEKDFIYLFFRNLTVFQYLLSPWRTSFEKLCQSNADFLRSRICHRGQLQKVLLFFTYSILTVSGFVFVLATALVKWSSNLLLAGTTLFMTSYLKILHVKGAIEVVLFGVENGGIGECRPNSFTPTLPILEEF